MMPGKSVFWKFQDSTIPHKMTVSSVFGFFGFGNSNRRFIPDYGAQRAFEQNKEVQSNAVAKALPVGKENFVLLLTPGRWGYQEGYIKNAKEGAEKAYLECTLAANLCKQFI